MSESRKLTAKVARRSPAKSLSDWAARFLVIAAGLSLNDIFSRAFGVGQVATPAMLAASIVLLVNINYRVISLPTLLFSGLMASYLGLGLVFSLIVGIADSATGYIYSFISAIVLVLSMSNYIVNIKSGSSVLSLIIVMRNTFLISSMLTIATPVLDPFLTHNTFTPDGRFRGVFSNPNEAGYVGLLAWLLCVTFPFKNKVVQSAAILVTIVAVVLTLSKSCIVALIILLAYKSFDLRRPKRTFATSAAAALIAIVIGKSEYFLSMVFKQYSTLLSGPQLRRILDISSILSGNINSNTTTGRTDLWAFSFSRIYDDFPLAGGLGSYHNIVGGIASEGVWQGSHNLFIMLLGESGPIPLLFLIAMVMVCVARAMRNSGRIREFLLLSWAILILQWMSSHGGLEHRWLLVFLGLVLGLAIRLNGKVGGRSPGNARPVGRHFIRAAWRRL